MFRFSVLTVAALIITSLIGINEAWAAVTGYNVMYRNGPSSNWSVYTQAPSQASANAAAAQLTQQGYLTEVVPVGVATSSTVVTGGTYYAAPGGAWGGYHGRPGYWGHYGYAGSYYGQHGYNHHDAYHHNYNNHHHTAHHATHHHAAQHHAAHHAGHHGGHHGGHHR